MSDGHRHVARIDTSLEPVVAYCDRCGVELVPDVGRWARDRGLVAVLPAFEAANIRARIGVIKDAIEKAVNRDPGLAP